MKWVSSMTLRILGVVFQFALVGGARTGGYPTEVNRVMLEFWGTMNGYLFPICLPHQGCGKLGGPYLSLHDAMLGAKASSVKSSA